MKPGNKIWVVEAHDLGALQVRAAADALALNRKKWLERKPDAGRRTTPLREAATAGQADDGQEKTEDRTGKADRMLVGLADSIEGALEVERELKRMRRNTTEGEKDVNHEETK